MGRGRTSANSTRKAVKAKRRPTPRTPIPASVRAIVEAMHQRYALRAAAGRGPAIEDEAVATTLATATEAMKLVKAGYWPVPPEVIRLGGTRRDIERRQLVDLIRAELADQLPSALATLGVLPE